MEFLEKFSELGVLNWVEVYDFYDRPVLFSCRSLTDTLYLAIFAHQVADADVWLFLPMSQNRFNSIRSGKMDLHDAYRYAEDKFVFEAREYYDESIPVTIQRRSSDSISEDWLSVPGEMISMETVTLPVLDHDVVRRAAQMSREVVDLSLVFLGEEKASEAPAKELGLILIAFQEIIETIGTKVRKMLASFKGSLQFSVVNVGAGSFEVELASDEMTNLFGESDAGLALQYFIHLLGIGGSNESLRQELRDLNLRGRARYLRFLQSLDNANADAQLRWGSPNPDLGGSVSISVSTARRIMQVIRAADTKETQEFSVTGILIGGSLRLRTFEISDQQRSYKGKFAGDLMELPFAPALGATYTAAIREISTLVPATGFVSVEYLLIGLYPPGLPETQGS